MKKSVHPFSLIILLTWREDYAQRKIIMYRRRSLTMFLVTISFAYSTFISPSHAHESSEAHLVFIAPDVPPYYQNDDQGNPIGILDLLFDKIAKDADLPYDRVFLPPKRAVKRLLAGTNGISIVAKNPAFSDHKDIVTFNEPLGFMLLNIYQRIGRVSLKTKENLKSQKVMLLDGYGYGGLRSWLEDPKNSIAITSTTSPARSISSLVNDKINAALLYDVNFKRAVSKLGYTPKDIISYPLVKVPLYLHINKAQTKNADKKINRLTKSYKRLKKAGKLLIPGSKEH